MPAIRVVIADDDATVLSALNDVLEADHRFVVVGLAASGSELRAVAAETDPDVVLLDIRMPDGGASAARAVLEDAAQRSSAPVVVAVSAHTAPSTVATMIQAGVVGYLAKGRLAELPDLVARCASGELVLAVPNEAGVLAHLDRETLSPACSASRASRTRGSCPTGPPAVGG